MRPSAAAGGLASIGLGRPAYQAAAKPGVTRIAILRRMGRGRDELRRHPSALGGVTQEILRKGDHGVYTPIAHKPGEGDGKGTGKGT
jgi:hypothetical protein